MPSTAAEPDTVHLVTGGGGYPGFNLGRKLAQSGKQVILVDIIQPRWPLEENMKFIQVIELYMSIIFFNGKMQLSLMCLLICLKKFSLKDCIVTA